MTKAVKATRAGPVQHHYMTLAYPHYIPPNIYSHVSVCADCAQKWNAAMMNIVSHFKKEAVIEGH